MATTADFRNGLCIQHNGDPWKIESFQHVKPGKGPAFVRTKIRNLNTGRLLENGLYIRIDGYCLLLKYLISGY